MNLTTEPTGALTIAPPAADARTSDSPASAIDRALIAAANYLRHCGIHHPDVLRDECHRLVETARQRLNAGGDAGSIDDERLSGLTLDLAFESVATKHQQTSTPTQQVVIPTIQPRALVTNTTPGLIGPLRIDWWVARLQSTTLGRWILSTGSVRVPSNHWSHDDARHSK
ncbi:MULTISPECIES: hypothetical protein [Crateriforma]|uniref:Uncharacterized protein n=1 Tax=Crateriforma conspicua TaxID=2527996 RepID=A0A5C6FU57_9PLAN|nr:MULTISPECIES: hypothetical protein [Crateriforma]TWU64743.1 hypothetical protein V7x_02870 [Crateriforma conspicua]